MIATSLSETFRADEKAVRSHIEAGFRAVDEGAADLALLKAFEALTRLTLMASKVARWQDSQVDDGR